jgi:hypothetical protein
VGLVPSDLFEIVSSKEMVQFLSLGLLAQPTHYCPQASFLLIICATITERLPSMTSLWAGANMVLYPPKIGGH